MSILPYPKGMDAAWLASDRYDHVAIFFTAAEGPIPLVALSPEYVPLEDIEPLMGAMQKLGPARLLRDYGDPSIFVDLAQRGLFVYDWGYENEMAYDSFGAYLLAVSPTTPIKSRALVPDLDAAARAVKLPNIAFDRDLQIHIRAHVECSECE